MSLVKEIEENGATLAWSPLSTMPNFVALGTKDSGAGGFDDYGGKLELHRLNFQEPGLKCPVAASVKTSGKFSNLAWSPMSNYADGFPSGLLAGGMTDGGIHLWDPAKLLASHPQSQLGSMKHHSGSVTLDFNPNPGSYHLLASGGADASVLVHALDRPDTPKQPYLPAPDANAAKHTAEISKVAWNSKVAHILASASMNGSCHIWDLRQKKSWCELRDAKKGAISDVAWNPSEGFQVVTAMGDDSNPVINMWDLRSSTTMPLSQLVGHTQGILSMSWCPFDTSLLLSCGKDGHTYLWDLYERKPVYEFTADTRAAPTGGFGGFGMSAGRRYQVAWSPKQRATLASCSFDGKVQVHSMSGTRTECSRAPKWLRRPCGASFGFGGKLISFHENEPAPGQPPSLVHNVLANTVVEDKEVVEASVQFEKTMETQDYKALCESKSSLAAARGDEHEASIWRFIQLVFEDSARSKLLINLGFDPAVITQEVSKFVSSPSQFADPKQTEQPPALPVVAGETPTEASDKPSVNEWIEGGSNNGASAEDFFNGEGGGASTEESSEVSDVTNDLKKASLEPVEGDKVIETAVKVESAPAAASFSNEPCVSIPFGESDLVRNALLIGNFAAAVDGCFHRGQYADALLLASCGGAELWEQTRRRFFERESANRPYLHIVKAVINSQLSELVAKSDLKNWKQTLAILSTYAKSEEFSSLCEELGVRLENEVQDLKSASLCYLCAINVPKTVEIWVDELNQLKDEAFKQASSPTSSASSQSSNPRASMNNSMALHALVEKVIVFGQGEEGNDVLGPKVAELFTLYGALLANQGEMATASKYITSDDVASMELKHRLFFASQMDLTGAPHPPLPFTPIHVGISPSISGIKPAVQPAATSANYATAASPHPATQNNNTNNNHAAASAGADSIDPNTGLPIGWIWQTDPNTNRVYYVNTMTGVTQWEPPQPTPAPAPTPATPVPTVMTPTTPTPVTAQNPTSMPSASTSSSAVMPGLPKTDGFKSGPGPRSEAYVPESSTSAAAASPDAPAAGIPPEFAAVVPAINDLTSRLTPSCTSPPEKKQLGEAVKASGILTNKLSNGLISSEISTKAMNMIVAIQYADYTAASSIHKDLSASAWDEHKDWVKGIKGFIVLAQKKFR